MNDKEIKCLRKGIGPELMKIVAAEVAAQQGANSSTPSVSLLQEGAAETAPLADAELAELVEMEQQATPAPWTAWEGQGKVFYGKPEINTPGHYSPANIELFSAHDFDREDEDMDVQPGTAEDDAAFVAAMRNALPGVLARLAAAEARAEHEHQIAAEAVNRLSALSQCQQERGGRYSLGVSKQDLLDAANLVQSRGLKREASMMRSLIDQVEDLQELAPTPVAIEEGGGWISVEERLPETRKLQPYHWLTVHESELVLGIEEGETKVHLYYCNEKGQWRQSGVEFHGNYAQVTHWQPLPTAPAKKEAHNG